MIEERATYSALILSAGETRSIKKVTNNSGLMVSNH